MRKLLLALALSLVSTGAWAQCNGVFPANTLCGNLSGSPAPPAAFSAAGTIVGPAVTTSGHIPTWSTSLGTTLNDPNTISTSQSLGLTGQTSLATTFITSLNVTSDFSFNGSTITFPASGTVGLIGQSQTWTASNSFTQQVSVNDLIITRSISLTVPLSVSMGGTGLTSQAAHTLPINEGTSVQNQTAVGTAAQCVNGNAGADPTFGGGCWVLLSSQSITSGATAVSDFSHMTNTISDYEVVLENVVPTATNASVLLQVHAAGAFQGASYSAFAAQIIVGGTGFGTTSTGSVPLNGNTTPTNIGTGITGFLKMYNPVTSSSTKHMVGEFTAHTSNGFLPSWVAASFTSASTAVDGFQITVNAGALASGQVKLYGRQ